MSQPQEMPEPKPPPRPKVWADQRQILAWVDAGKNLREIGELNGAETGWTPDESTISKLLKSLGVAKRHGRRRDLIPWDLAPEDRTNRYVLMLQAESRRREIERGVSTRPLSVTDKKAIAMLNYTVFPDRGPARVIGYRKDIGFHLLDRKETDIDIIRP